MGYRLVYANTIGTSRAGGIKKRAARRSSGATLKLSESASLRPRLAKALMLEVEVPLTYIFSFLPVNRCDNSRPGSASKLLNQKYLYRFKGGPEGIRVLLGVSPV
jgi:hypothetical protein